MDAPYDAFISYNHRADQLLAARLQSALHRFAKPWYRLRAVHVFRDETDLAATPELWSTIERALGNARFFILLASPKAAASRWVDKEVAYWLEHRSAHTLLLVVTDGDWAWDPTANDFDWARSLAIPPRLRGAYEEEPRLVDLRGAHRDEDYTLRNPEFLNAVADLSVALRGLEKSEIVGEDVRQHRRNVRTALLAAIALAILALVSAALGVVADQRRQEAEQRERLARRPGYT